MRKRDLDPEDPMIGLTRKLMAMAPGDVLYIETRSREESTEVARGVTARKALNQYLHDRNFTTSQAVAVFHGAVTQHVVRITCKPRA